MQVDKTELDGVLMITPPTIFEDFRGAYVELYNQDIYKEHGIEQDFIQDDISVSRRHVLRGLHGDMKTTKLISCLIGAFYFVVVNNKPDSHQYRQWQAFTLSETNRKQVLVPPGYANGHLVLTESAMFHYKQTTLYDRESQFTILWDDPEYAIWWPMQTPVVSQRDQGVG